MEEHAAHRPPVPKI